MEKIHLIKTPFRHRRTNLSKNHKSKKFRAADTSMTYDAQSVDHQCDNSLSEANETVGDHTFGSETTFDKSIETASLMSSVSEENTLALLIVKCLQQVVQYMKMHLNISIRR